jgi:LuxR family maltose regulon positive regulatory protein
MAEQADAPSAAPLIRAKLQPPVARELVSRRLLLDRLRGAGPRKLVLISASAGWGKSTLLADWYRSEREERSFAWLALDAVDNDPAAFWAYVIEALRAVEPRIGAGSLAMLAAPGVDLTREMLPALLNELTELDVEAVLVLDDYYLIRTTDIHEGMAFLIEHLPAGLQVALASRSDPPFPLPRLRAGGDLLEIDASQLSFSHGDAEELLNGLHGLGLPPDDVDSLRERTEGWAAGLYLAALSLRERDDPTSFIERFAGDDRHVADYLGEEVLAGQRDDVRSFLLRTSVLERLTADLCDAVTGETKSAAMLEEIARSNLFLIPLDARRAWYRYHHLFRELLRHELTLAESELIADLHRRAAGWLLDAGLISEGIRHTIAAGDAAEAAELVAGHWLPYVNAGNRATAEGWLDALPDEVVRADARLCLARAWVSYSAGRMDEVLPWTEAAEAADLRGPFRDGTTSVASGTAILRTSYYLLIGDFSRAREFAREALELERFPAWRAVAANGLGSASYWLDDSATALRMLEETSKIGRDEMPVVVMFALGHLALISIERGDWEQAERLATAAASMVDECAAHEYWAASRSHAARGQLLEHQGRLPESEAELERGLTLARRGTGPVETANILLALAGVRHALGKVDEARALVAEAREAIEACPDPGRVVRRQLERTERQVRVAGVGGDGAEGLSDRELAVLRLLPTPLSQREIGDQLYVSLNTVKSHTKSIYRKLDVGNREQAVSQAQKLGLL